jgi:hypothetical protein
MDTLQKNYTVDLWYDDTKPQVIENKICEVTDHLKAALRSGMTSLQVIIASARSVGFGGGAMIPWHCCIVYIGQALRHKE